MNVLPEERFDEYPKLRELLKLKNEIIAWRNHPPVYIRTDLKTFDFSSIGKFDVVLVDPPWGEYQERVRHLPLLQHEPERFSSWTFEDI